MTGASVDAASFKWPTLGDTVKSWEGTCDHCGELYPPETRILARLSPTSFCISCECSPRQWVQMVCVTQ
jgi:hypothetical protein